MRGLGRFANERSQARGTGGGRRSGRVREPSATELRLGPLRRIVSEGVGEHGVETETLECGHTLHRKQDIIGPTNAARRRCRHCRDARAAAAGGGT